VRRRRHRLQLGASRGGGGGAHRLVGAAGAQESAATPLTREWRRVRPRRPWRGDVSCGWDPRLEAPVARKESATASFEVAQGDGDATWIWWFDQCGDGRTDPSWAPRWEAREAPIAWSGRHERCALEMPVAWSGRRGRRRPWHRP
jgi:hypothetical protein